MKLESGQGGLLREALRLVVAPNLSFAVGDLVLRERDALMTALWHHWLAASLFADRWVPPSAWPREVVESTEEAPKGNAKKRHAAAPPAPSFNAGKLAVWQGRLALLASLGRLAVAAAPARQTPALSRPRQLGRLVEDLARLENLVSAPRVFEALRRSFGASIVDPLVFGASLPTEAPTLADVVLKALVRQVPRLGPGADLTLPRPRPQADFALHVEVERQCRQILGDDLPFADDDATRPPLLARWLGQIDRLELALTSALLDDRPADGIANRELLPWGLALTAVLRAYATDAYALAALVSLPISTLYSTPTDETHLANASAKSTLPLNRNAAPLVKHAYSSYTGVGLWEAWTGDAVGHADPADGKAPYAGAGYLWRQERPGPPLADAARVGIDSFVGFWGEGQAPARHREFGATLAGWRARQGAIPGLPPQDKKPRSGSPKIPISVAEAANTATAWTVIPALRIPRHDPKDSRGRLDFENLWERTAHLHVQAALYAADQILLRLGTLQGLSPQSLRLGDGSPRWGGNHAPHFEHRDGLTFDISDPVHFPRWLQTSKAKEKGPKQTRYPGVVYGVCSTEAQAVQGRTRRRFLAEDIDKVVKKGPLTQFLGGLAKAPSTAEAVDDFVKTKLWGLPVHGGDSPDSGALRHNLLGHVALALAGIRKLIYAGVIQHVYALGIVARALGADRYARPVIERQVAPGFAQFFFAPNDHHNHWHVVFPDRAQWLDGDAPGLGRYVQLWRRLGIDLNPLAAALADRDLLDEGGVERDRQTLLRLLTGPAGGEAPALVDAALLPRLAEAIAAQGYPDASALRPCFDDVTPRYQIDGWSDEPPDSIPVDEQD